MKKSIILSLFILCFAVFVLYFFLSVPALFDKSISFATILTDRITTICFPIIITFTTVAIYIIRNNKG